MTLNLRFNRLKIVSLLVVVAVCHSLPQAFAKDSPQSAKTAELTVKYRTLPLSFEANMGQSDPTVHYLCRGQTYSLLFRDHQVDLMLAMKGHASAARPQIYKQRKFNEGDSASVVDALDLRLIGASADSEPVGRDKLPGIVNYFSGNNPRRWHTAIPTFGKVEYSSVYPGINLVYYGNPSKLEFDFQVTPGASASNIRLHFDGAKRLELDGKGDLVVDTTHGHISFHKPLIYQFGFDNTRLRVEGSFRLFADGTVGFTVGHYDHARPLVIDPILDYSTYLGTGSGVSAIAVDPGGEAFVAGWAGANMPTTTGGYQPDFPTAGKNDNAPVGSSPAIDTAAFVAKFNSAGTALIYCTYLSGSENDAADAIAIDGSGNAFVAGATASSDFPVTAGAFQTENQAPTGETGFITELNSAGSGLIYSTFLGGSQGAQINGVALDSMDNVFVTGPTVDLDFPVTLGAFQATSPVSPIVGGKGFVTKLAAGGQKLLYSTYLGGSDWDLPYGIAIDASENAYITGGTQSPDFPTTPDAFQLVNTATLFNFLGGSFVTKLNPTGSALVYSTYLDGSEQDVAYAIAVDAEGNAYVTGFATSSDFPTTPGVFQPALGISAPDVGLEMSNAFVTKLNPDGTGLVYSTFLGGSQSYTPGTYGDAGLSIAVDSSGNAYVTGSTEDLDFPITPGALQLYNIAQSYSGALAGFLTKIDPTASEILYSTYLTGSSYPSFGNCDCVNGIAFDSSQNVYVAGRTFSTDFPTTLGTYQDLSDFGPEGGVAAFVTKFNSTEMQQLPLSITTVTASKNPQLNGQPVTFTATVESASGNTPTGTVGFTILGLSTNGNPSAYGPWNDVALDDTGTAEFTTSSLESGSSPVVAYYLGDARNSPSTGNVTENVNQIPTTTTITSNMASAPYETPLTFTATVVETASGRPAQGEIFFDFGSLSYDLVPLNSAGQATWTSGATGAAGILPVGTDEITAEFVTSNWMADQDSQASVPVNVTGLGMTAAPTFSPSAGTYSAMQEVTLGCTMSEATIYYTTDGSTPTAASAVYVSGVPIQVGATETIQAVAFAPGYSASPVVSATYVINLPTSGFTVSANPTSLAVDSGGSIESRITVNASNGFSQAVSFSCSGLPAGASCSFAPTTVDGNGSTILTISVPTTAAVVRRPTLAPLASAMVLSVLIGWLPLRRERRRDALWFIAVGVLACFSLGACGGSGAGNSDHNSGSYEVTVDATSGLLSQSVTLALNVTGP